MAVYNNTSAAGNVSWSSMDTWSTEYSSNSNISWRIVAQACIPADSVFPLTNNYSISDLLDEPILYGNVYRDGAAGSVRVSSGYLQNAAQSFSLKNNLFNETSTITIRVTATYPNYISGWYTATNKGGTQLAAGGTSTTQLDLNLTAATHTSVTDFYGHIEQGATYSSISLGYDGSSDQNACDEYNCGTQNTYYTDGSGTTWYNDGKHLAQNSNGSTAATAGHYSDGTRVRYWNGSAFSGFTSLCSPC
ncbi:MAG: hypothetical protein CMA95_00015 [Euryarchaeota archaeon]|nr:hypothetical protein [Euryarchaeota archaeon]